MLATNTEGVMSGIVEARLNEFGIELPETVHGFATLSKMCSDVDGNIGILRGLFL